jgi:hypothetical protein
MCSETAEDADTCTSTVSEQNTMYTLVQDVRMYCRSYVCYARLHGARRGFGQDRTNRHLESKGTDSSTSAGGCKQPEHHGGRSTSARSQHPHCGHGTPKRRRTICQAVPNTEGRTNPFGIRLGRRPFFFFSMKKIKKLKWSTLVEEQMASWLKVTGATQVRMPAMMKSVCSGLLPPSHLLGDGAMTLC